MKRGTTEGQEDFRAVLEAVRKGEPVSEEEVELLSVLEDADLASFREVWQTLATPQRRELVDSLRKAAEDVARLEFSAINYLAMDDADPALRRLGVESSLEDNSSTLLQRLVSLVRSDPEAEVRRAAVEDLARFALLGELGELDDDALQLVRGTLEQVFHDESEKPPIRSSALAALGYFSDEKASGYLVEAFLNPQLRLGAVRGMGRSADPRWTDRLLPVLGSADPDIRVEAARALAEIEDERAVGPLAELLEDPDADLREAAIAALGQIGGDNAREALLYVAEGGDEPTREAAERALASLEFLEDPLGP